MEDLPLGKTAALVPEFALKDLPLGRTLMMTYTIGMQMIGYKIPGICSTSTRFRLSRDLWKMF